MLPRLISNFIVLCADVPDVFSTESISLMSAFAIVTVGTGGVLQ